MELQIRKFWPGYLLGILLITLAMFFLCRYFPELCPFVTQCEECPEDVVAARIIVEDPHTAVWMPIDNTFLDRETLGTQTCFEDESTTEVSGDAYKTGYTHGVLIQVGELLVGQARTEKYFGGVELVLEGGDSKYLGADDFDWIDVRPPDLPPVIDMVTAWSMYENDKVMTGCETLDTLPGTLPEDPCLRLRRLHAGFFPNIGVITYWAGDNHFGIETSDGPEMHPEFTFNLPSEVNVDIWKNGCLSATEPKVKDVIVRFFNDDSDHSIFDDPPTDGGVMTFPPS